MSKPLRELAEEELEQTASAARQALHAQPEPSAQAAEEPAPIFSRALNSLLKWSAALLTLGGLALHVAGFIYHSEYDRAWGLDADLFPKSVEWILITGYQVMLMGMVKLWLFIKAEWWKLAAWGLLVGTLSWIGVCMALYGREIRPRRYLSGWIKRMPKWLAAAMLSYGYAAGVCLLIAFAPIVAVSFIFMPGWMAVDQAKTAAESDLAKYTLGCENPEQKKRCVSLRREGKPVLRGFLIDSSDHQLAIYLPEQNALQVVAREGVEIEVGFGEKPESNN